MSKRKKRLTIIVTVIFALLFLGSGVLITFLVDDRDRLLAAHNKQVSDVGSVSRVTQELLGRLKTARTLKKKETVFSDAQKSPKKVSRFLQNVSRAKVVEERFFQQEGILRRVAALLKANKNDPLVPDYFKEARLLNDRNAADLEFLSEISGNCEWNRRLHYLVGLLHYRSLVFLKKKERFKARNIIDQALQSFEKVFICAPHDRDAQVAIELLYKESKNRGGGSGAGNEASRRLRLMPNPGRSGRGNRNTQREQGRY